MPFLEFTRTHGERLAHVHDQATLAEWHVGFATAWASNADALARAGNDALGFRDEHAHRLQPDVGYLAVETEPGSAARPKRWMLVSLNPGWDEVGSPKERVAKGQEAGAFSLERYASFRTRFFPRYPDMVGAGCRWWSDALGFLHAAASLERPARADGVLPLHPDLDVIGWELWPFHSDKDGLSGRAGHRDDTGRALTTFAMESLQAACRVAASEDRRVVVASAKARQLLERDQDQDDRHRTFDLVRSTVIPRRTREVRCAVYRSRANGHEIAVVRLQVFAGHVSREVRAAALAFVRG
jgi:hypothetical protein